MQYTTLVVAAAAAFSGLVGAQNSSLTLPSGIQPCCSVSANSVPSDLRSEWCRATQNTCPEICGGQGQIASGGNNCDSQTLQHTCECRNGTKPNLAEYEQTIEGQECRFWHAQCINATNQDAALQFNCNTVRDQMCGNKTSKAATTSSSSGSPTTSRTSGNGGGSSGTATSSGSAQSSTNSPAAAIALDAVRNYGTPILAGGMAAVFGLVL